MNSTRNLKLIIAGLLLALVFSIFYRSCESGKIAIDESVNKNEICMDFSSEQESKLTHGLVGDMVNLYRIKQWNSIKGSTTSPMVTDANTIWFELDSIKKFIYTIERTVKNNPGTENSKLGLRIYYAAYPEMSQWGLREYKDLSVFRGNPITEQYEKMHTLVMLPTIQTAGGAIKDINLFDVSTFTTGIPKYEYINGISTMPPAFRTARVSALLPIPSAISDPSAPVSAKNHGTLYPPGNPIDLSY